MWYSSLYLYTSGISNGAWVSFAPGTSRSSVLPSNTYTTGKQKHPNILFLTLETASIDRQATGRQSSRKSWGAPLIHLPSPQPTSYCFPLLPFSFLYNFWVCVWEACQSSTWDMGKKLPILFCRSIGTSVWRMTSAVLRFCPLYQSDSIIVNWFWTVVAGEIKCLDSLEGWMQVFLKGRWRWHTSEDIPDSIVSMGPSVLPLHIHHSFENHGADRQSRTI